MPLLKFILVFACVLTTSSSLLAQSSPYEIRVGNAANSIRQGGNGYLPVYLVTGDVTGTPLTGFELAFNFSHPLATGYFEVTNATLGGELGPALAGTTVGTINFTPSTDFNYDVQVNAGFDAVNLARMTEYKLFDLHFTVSDDAPVTLGVSDPYTLAFNPVATQTGSPGLNSLYIGTELDLDPVTTISTPGSFNVAAVPEPASIVLCSLGASIAGFGAWKRRRRQSACEETATLTA